MLSRFQWYRRMRGGYWAQVTAPLGILAKTRWTRCKETQPTPDQKWEFYPWAKKTMGNGYIDEWYFVEPMYAVHLSHYVLQRVNRAIELCKVAETEKRPDLIPAIRALLQEATPPS